MKLRSKIVLAAIAAAMLISFSNKAEACSCVPPRPPCEAYGTASAVFVGIVADASTTTIKSKSGEREFEYPQRLFRFSVQQSFKGISTTEVEIITGNGGGDCGYGFKVGEHYLVYAYRGSETERFGTSICTRTRHISDASEDLQYLRGLSKAKPGSRIYGKVERQAGDPEYGPVKTIGPMAGIKVVLEGEGQRYEAITDSSGRYEINGLPTGRYGIQVELPDHLGSNSMHSTSYDHESKLIALADRGCAEENFWVLLDGRINGRVIDSEGKPVPDATVDLINADSLGSSFRELKGKQATTDKEGRYEFQMIQPGRYVLGINVKKPPDAEMPYARTYFPGVSDSTQATVIVVGEGTKVKDHDFHLQPQKVREIKGTVVWSDGRPVSGAVVSLDLAEYPEYLKMFGKEADEQGRFTIKGIDGFKYSVHAHINESGPTHKTHYAEPVEITVTEDMQPVRLVMPASSKKR